MIETIKKRIKAIWNAILGKPHKIDTIAVGVEIKKCRECNRAELIEGYWRKSDLESTDYECSVCGGSAWFFSTKLLYKKSRFCPNCGALMKNGG